MTTGFVLDDFSEWTKTVEKGAVIAEVSIEKQMEVNVGKRLFGFDALFRGLNPKDGEKGDAKSGLINWENLKNLAQTKDYQNATTNIAKAEKILDNIFLYDKDVIFSDKRGDSSNWFYAQNFQSDIPGTWQEAYKADTNGFYAQVAAILWAFRQYKPDIPIFPVFDSYLLKSAGTFDITTIQQNLGLLGLTNSKGDSIITKIPETAPVNTYGTGNNWNIISTLYHSNLIDGFIGDSFKVGKEGTIPSGDLPDGSLPFYLEKSNLRGPIPYALDSNYYDLTYLEAATPITSNYFGNIYNYGESFEFGDMPLSASVYVPTEVSIEVIVDGKKTPRTLAISLPDNFDSKLYITPQKIPLGYGIQAPVNSNPKGSTYLISNGDYNTGSIVNDGTMLNPEVFYNYGIITNNGVIDFTGGGSIIGGGTVNGNGKFIGDHDNTGTLAPGNSAGGMLFEGNLTVGETSTTEVELGGTDHFDFHRTDTEHDFVDITGDLIINGGELNVSLIDGFELSLDQEFIISKIDGELTGTFKGLQQGAIVGKFDSVFGEMEMNLFINYEAGDGNDIALYTEDFIGLRYTFF